MSIKEKAEELESMIDEDSIIEFDTDMSIEENEEDEKKRGLDIVSVEAPKRLVNVQESDSQQDIIDDYEFARNSHIHNIEQLDEVISAAIELNRQSPSARNLEVLGQLFKIKSDSTDKLLKHQKDSKELNKIERESSSQTADTINNTNVVFNGSAEQLIDMLNGEDIKVVEDEDDI